MWEYTGACPDPDCQRPLLCCGNRLQLLPCGRIELYAPHHKADRRWRGAPIRFVLPPDLAVLLKAYLGWARGLITRCQDPEQQTKHVFYNPNTCKPLNEREVAALWTSIVIPDDVRVSLGPQLLRSIYVHERCEAGRVNGPAGVCMPVGWIAVKP